MNTEPQLTMFDPPPPADPNVQWLIDYLRVAGWTTRDDIVKMVRALGRPCDERWVRQHVEAAGVDIVKGQRGFNHFSNCTVEEIGHSANQSENQGRKMLNYALELRRRCHQLGGRYSTLLPNA